MEEAEWSEIQAAADRARLTVSEWVRLVLRDARSGTPPASPAVRESAATYASDEAATGTGGRTTALVDEALLQRVMDAYHLPTGTSAIHFALRRLAPPPMGRSELLAVTGTGWEGTLEDLLLRPDVLSSLRELAMRRGVTVARLISDAVEAQYGLDGSERRRAAAEAIAAMSLPVGTPAEMKRESVPHPDELLP